MKLKGKVIVITGSTRGIGRAIAEACAQEGASVVVSSRNQSAVEETVITLKQQGFQVSGTPVDVSREGDLEKLLKYALNKWGRVDVWVNNAGLSSGYQFLYEMGEEEIASIVNVNLTAVLKACRLVIPYFIKQGGGIIINTTGKGGRGEASPFTTVYAATKAAVTSLTKSLAQEYKDQPISIHAILPGMVETDFYKDVKTSPKLTAHTESIPLVLKAIGTPKDLVGHFFVEIAVQEPGKVTGKIYSLFKGRRRLKGIAKLVWYRITGRIESA